MRVHPILNWSEKDVWVYTIQKEIAYNPLYDRIEHPEDNGGFIYRSIGCWPCTKAIPIKDADKANLERSGRDLDKEEIMEDLRALGYM